MTAVQGEPPAANVGQGWTVDDSTFGARLALVRQRMQWNIKEAARECGIPAASWGTWENGAMPRRYTEMCRLISFRTGCDYGWLLDGPRLKAAPNTQLDLDAIAKVLDVDPDNLRSRLREGRSSQDFEHAPAESAATIGHLSVPLTGRVTGSAQRRPIGPSKPGPNRPVSAVPARRRRPQPVRPAGEPARV